VPALYRALAGKYFVDELYEAVFVRGMALGGGRAFHAVDRYVVDGGDGDVRRGAGVNGLAWLARDVVARASNLWDRYVVDGAVNLTGTAAENASYVARAMQNGLVQHYAWLMLVGVFALVLVGRWILGLP
jgi:NADH-quinone oxidoreductase subunit L